MPFKKVELSVRETPPKGIRFYAGTSSTAVLYNGAIPKVMEEALLRPIRMTNNECWDAGEHVWQAFSEEVDVEHLTMLFDGIHAEAERLWNETHAEHMLHEGNQLCQMSEEELATVFEMGVVNLGPETCTECKRRFRAQVTEVDELVVSGEGAVGIDLG